MKHLISILAICFLPFMTVEAVPETECPVLVATDIWTEYDAVAADAQDMTYYIHFQVANTTDKSIADYEVDFVTNVTDSDGQQEQLLGSTHITPLAPHSISNATVKVTTAISDTIRGYLTDGNRVPISDYLNLTIDNKPIIEIKHEKTFCFYKGYDAKTNEVVYHFSTFACNKSGHDIHQTQLNLFVLTQGNGTNGLSSLPLLIDSLESDSLQYVSQQLRIPLGEPQMKLWITDRRGILLMDSTCMNLPKDATEYTAPIIERDSITTKYTLDEHYFQTEYSGDSLRTGIIMAGSPFYSGISSDEFLWPKQVEGFHLLKDLYGNYVFKNLFSRLISNFFFSCQYTEEGYSFINDMKSVLRGGDYIYHRHLDVINKDRCDTVRIYGEPVVRYNYQNPTIGQPLNIDISANTGYPYADSLLTVIPKMDYQLIYIKPHNGRAAGDTITNWREGTQMLSFNLERYPRLAGVDTLNIHVDDPDIGDYLLAVKSDFNNHQRMTHVQITDTVRMDIKMERSTFRKGVDSTAVVHYKIDYRWPYVVPEAGDSVPTVRFKAECFRDSISLSKQDSLCIDSLYKQQAKMDSLIADSIIQSHTIRTYYVNDSLIITVPPYTYLYEEGDFTFRIDSLPANEDNTVRFTLRFNAQEQKAMSYVLRLNNPTIGIEEIPIDSSQTTGLPTDSSAPFYDLSGRKIHWRDNRNTHPRIVIQNNRKFISR